MSDVPDGMFCMRADHVVSTGIDRFQKRIHAIGKLGDDPRQWISWDPNVAADDGWRFSLMEPISEVIESRTIPDDLLHRDGHDVLQKVRGPYWKGCVQQ